MAPIVCKSRSPASLESDTVKLGTPLPEATKRGIVVCNAADGPSDSTAEHAIAAIVQALQVLREAKPIHLANPEIWRQG